MVRSKFQKARVCAGTTLAPAPNLYMPDLYPHPFPLFPHFLDSHKYQPRFSDEQSSPQVILLLSFVLIFSFVNTDLLSHCLYYHFDHDSILCSTNLHIVHLSHPDQFVLITENSSHTLNTFFLIVIAYFLAIWLLSSLFNSTIYYGTRNIRYIWSC